MSKYTVTLHDLLKNDETKALIQKAMSSYPIYKPIHEQIYGFIPTREQLNTRILNKYRFYEIGSETIERFLFNLETALNEIMPYYNQKYKSIDIMNGVEDIFGNVDVTETFQQSTASSSSNSSNEEIESTNDGSTSETTNVSTSDNNSNSTSSNTTSSNESNTEMSTNGRNVNAKTPQSQLQVKSINNITAASEMNWNEDSSNSNSTSNDTATSSGTSETTSSGTSETTSSGSNNNESNQTTTASSSGTSTGTTTHTMTKKGNQGVSTYAHDLFEFRQLFENIEQQIINDKEIATCFMLIW